MKNYLKISIFCTALLLGSCSDFLNEKLKGNYSTDTFYTTGVQALLGLTGVYNGITFTSTDNAIWVFGDVASDDAVKGGKDGDLIDIGTIDQFSYSTNNSYIQNQWRFYFDDITRANFLLYYLPRITDMDAALKKRVEGETKFLRAYCYFNLVNIYGAVPLHLLPPLDQATTYLSKSPVEAIYAQIEKDLTEAAPVLSASYTGLDVGRATKGAAYGLLAKERLYQGQWQGALDAIDSLDRFHTYQLVPYQDSFIDSLQNNAEAVFEIEHTANQNPAVGSYLNQFFSPLQVGGGYYVDAPTQDFVDEFEQTADNTYDPRLDVTVGRDGNTWVNGAPFDAADWAPATGYLQKKNSTTGDFPSGATDLNYVYMRYADVLLMKAEALNELGRSAEALVPLNLVRARARSGYTGATPEPDLLPDVATTDQSTLREDIRHERRVELGFEFHRYFDLMRYGKAYAEAALAGTGFSYDTDRYFPIPQSELDSNPAINN